MVKTAFLGSKEFGLSILKQIRKNSITSFDEVIVVDDSKDPRSSIREYRSYETQENEKFFYIKSNNDLINLLTTKEISCVLVCGYYFILKKEILAMCKHGFWGIHNSLLPKYRGGSPLVWSLLNGDNEVGSTLFKLEEGVDDGDIVCQWKISVEKTEYIGDVLKKLEKNILVNISQHWDNIVSQNVHLSKQDYKKATFCAQRIDIDGLIDWKQHADIIYNFIRAQSRPYLGAYFLYKDRKVRIYKSKIFPQQYYCTPGQIIKIENDRVLIGCGGNTAIYIEEFFIDNNKINGVEVFKSISERII
jgi:methionyl-tRNA formyltransferase